MYTGGYVVFFKNHKGELIEEMADSRARLKSRIKNLIECFGYSIDDFNIFELYASPIDRNSVMKEIETDKKELQS